VVLVVIGLYIATTHDRWRWKRTLLWSGGTVLVLVAVGLGVVIALGAVLLWLAWRLYFSMSGDFAEEL
jgi:multisubunit Na+/H+ antiporter MnhB subunit